jgi:hypothetical protein
MSKIMIWCIGLATASALAGCGNSAIPPSAGSTIRSTPAPSPKTRLAAGSDMAWPALSEPGFQGSSCNLLPPQAFPAAGVTVTPSYINPGATMDSGVGFLTGTDGSGNATCQEYWQDPQGGDDELAIDFLEKTTQAIIWSYTDPPEKPHDYAGGPQGMQYGHFVSGGVPGIEVNAPDGKNVIDVLGYSGLTLPKLAKMLQIALDRAKRFAPTNTLYGVGS